VDGVKKHKILEAVMKNNICTSDTWDKLISGSIPANKKIISAYGTEAAIILAELLSRYRYFEANGRLQSNNIFFNSRKDLKNGTGLGRYTQARVLSKLVKAGLLEVYYPKGKARRFKLDLQKINSLLDNNPVENQPTINSNTDNPVDIQPTTRLKNNRLPGCNSATNNSTNNIINNEESTPSMASKEKDKKTSELKEVISLYYKLLAERTGETPVKQWAKDCSILKKAAAGQIMAQGAEKVKEKLSLWFKGADSYIQNRGYPLRLFVSQYNSIIDIEKGEKKPVKLKPGYLPGESDADFLRRKRNMTEKEWEDFIKEWRVKYQKGGDNHI
jgi:hypothetical protein